MRCRVCETDVSPAAAFCGTCGARLSDARGDGRGRLRMGSYAAAPGEHTLRLSVVSTLFPHLPHRSRTSFRIAFAVLFLALIAFALLRWQAPLITVGVLGLPLMFVLYLHESDIHRDMAIRLLALTAVLGVGLGIGYAFVTGALVADSYDVALGAGPDNRSLLLGFAVPVGGAVLMLVPAVVARLCRPDGRESLDGLVIGALGALAFTSAATLTRLAPQFTTGVTARDLPAEVLLVEAGIQAIAMPLTAASIGGLVGIALWARRRTFIVPSVLVALGLYMISGALEVLPLLHGLHFGLYILIAVFSLVALRLAIQAALLHEQHDPPDPGHAVLCPHCDHVVVDVPFCPNCGVAARASSRTGRNIGRGRGVGDKPQVRPAYAMPADSYVAAPVRITSLARLLTTVGAGAVVTAAAGVTAAALAMPVTPRFVCPPDCGGPPIAAPVESNPRFVSADGRFSVQYPGTGSAYEATLNPDGVDLDFVGGDTGTMQLFGLPANDRSAQEITDDLIHEYYPDAVTDYEIPNAMVGYQPGYGVVVDEYPQDSSGRFTRLRLVVMTAVKDDYALVAAAIGPYHQFDRDFGNGHPSGANLQLAMDMGKYVNSFQWRSAAN
jgi:hypothetical protein